ncbi:MAG TPA: sulfotransferase [Caulobacteraceae bacterium]|nr:sulfotransferase [Caulobacteraceae bacterium]
MNHKPSRREEAQASFEAGNARLAQGAWQAAKQDFEQALALDARHAEAHLGLATAYRNLGNWAEAERCARSALGANPRYGRAAHYLGALLVEQDRLAEALPFLQTAAHLQPEVAQHHRDLGVTQLFLGDIEGARDRLLQTLELDVLTHEVLYTLIRMCRMDDGSESAARLLEIVRDLETRADDLPAPERAQVLFSLGKAHEDRGEYAAAASAFARANKVKRESLQYDVGAAEARLQRLAQIFDARRMGELAGAGDRSQRPIFIVGMPRSGSTLVEQILASHPQVHGGGELYVLPPMLEASIGMGGARYPDWAATMNSIDCAAIGKAYVDRLPKGTPPRSRTTDKWLDNFENVGLISAALPNAKIVHCHRDPRDQLLSCWSLLFSQNQEYAYDPQELVRYARAYRALMAHWRSVLRSGQMLEVRYESLVSAPEAQSRRLLAHCGLEWDEQVLRFWESQRPVKSASMVQVREPIYDRSIGRWKAFAPYVPELFDLIIGD